MVVHSIAKNVQNDLWRNRSDIWTDGTDRGVIDVLDPPSAFHAFGYTFERAPFLGQIIDGGDVTEVAGFIDKPKRYAAVSEQFVPVVQAFTAAHELGHAILHKADKQFRDRGLDGSLIRGHRPQVEYEADKFAAYFLMPESVMREAFRAIFGSDRFIVSNDSAFSLGIKDLGPLLATSPDMRPLSLRLAKAGMFAGNPVKPIAELFGVSYEAMAIRIEELDLIDLGSYRFGH